MLHIYFIRHAAVDYDAVARKINPESKTPDPSHHKIKQKGMKPGVQFDRQIPLSAEGEKELKDIGFKFIRELQNKERGGRHLGRVQILRAPATRCGRTAEAVGDWLSRTGKNFDMLEPDDLLGEIRKGKWWNLPREKWKEDLEYPQYDLGRRDRKKWAETRFPGGGEAPKHVMKRTDEFAEQLKKNYPKGTDRYGNDIVLVVVTHDMTLRALRRSLLNLSRGSDKKLPASWVRFDHALVNPGSVWHISGHAWDCLKDRGCVVNNSVVSQRHHAQKTVAAESSPPKQPRHSHHEHRGGGEEKAEKKWQEKERTKQHRTKEKTKDALRSGRDIS